MRCFFVLRPESHHSDSSPLSPPQAAMLLHNSGIAATSGGTGRCVTIPSPLATSEQILIAPP